MSTVAREQFEGSTRTKLALAAIACGPVAGLVLVLVIALMGAALSAAQGDYTNIPLQALLSGAVLGAVIGWPFMLVFGLPAHRLLYKRGSRRAGGYLLAGVIAGFIIAILMSLAFLPLGLWQTSGAYAGAAGVISLLCLFGSVLASWIFWLIRRPDKDVLRPASVAAAFE
ncbi:MAG: hypothetical protein Q8R02_14235 [Hyphomonadaceae bacterium]|nr:hypothetical protein [Hyphomonadaceae bacterium]